MIYESKSNSSSKRNEKKIEEDLACLHLIIPEGKRK
jgi:hypothetical protein